MEKRVKGLHGLAIELKRDMKKRQTRIKHAVERAARKGAAHVRRNVPVAFSELRDSVDERDGHRIVADAPHAEPVEIGSRPHTPPFEPILRWVRLRGMQALVAPSRQRRMPGTSTIGQAQRVGAMIAAQAESSGYAGWSGGATPADAAHRVAWAVVRSIAAHGTRPHWYMRSSVPVVVDILDQEIRRALPD